MFKPFSLSNLTQVDSDPFDLVLMLFNKLIHAFIVIQASNRRWRVNLNVDITSAYFIQDVRMLVIAFRKYYLFCASHSVVLTHIGTQQRFCYLNSGIVTGQGIAVNSYRQIGCM